MKAKKTSVIVCLVLAAIFAAVGVVLMLLPEPYSPVTVSEEVTASYSSGRIYFDGKLKNDSGESVVLTYLEIEVKVSGGTESGYIRETTVLAPGEEYDLNGLYIQTWYSPSYVSQVNVTVDGADYTVYSSSGRYFAFTVLAFMVAVILAVIGVASIAGIFTLNKRYRQAEKDIAALCGDAVLAVGCYGRKGEAGKAAAKTAVSVIGGAVSALLFGFGVYKVYGSKDMKEFVVAENGLYVGNFTRNKFNPDNMQFISKNEIPDSEIVAENKKVTMTNPATGEYFLFDLSSHSTLTAEELKTRLEKMLSSRQAVREAAPAESNTVPDGGEDPFAD